MTRTWHLLPERYREVALCVAGLLLVLLFTQVLPAASTHTRGAPTALLFEGLVLGLVSSLTAVGLVLIYRTTRILNFAQVALGSGAAVVCFDVLELDNAPFVLALALAIVLGGLLGTGFDLAFGRRFLNAPRLVLTVFTIVVATFLGNTGNSIFDQLPFLPPASLRTLDQTSGNYDLRPLLPLPSWHFTVGDLPIPFGFADVFAAIASVAALAGLLALLRYTRLGTALRAVPENPERAALLGISVGFMSTVVWTIAGVLSALSLTLTGFMERPATVYATAGSAAASALLPAFAAATLGRFRSIGVTAAAAVGISEVTTAFTHLQPDLGPVVSVVLLIITAGGLLLQNRRRSRSEEGITSSWTAMQELRPIPKEMLSLTVLRVVRWGAAAAGIAALAVFPFIADTGQTFLLEVIYLNAIIGLSLVVLTGWAGQVSLGQFGFAAVGAVLATVFAQRFGITFWIAAPAAGVITAALALAIGLPALRIPGLFLAVATFAFAVTMHDLLFNPHVLSALLPGGNQVVRPQLFLVDFDDERSMYFLCAAFLVIAIVAAVNLRRGRFGRVLIGIRENEANASSVGISVLGVKLTAFAFAGFLAGFAGAVLAFQQRSLSGDTFSANASVGVFVQVVIGGIGSVWGPVVGAAYFNGLAFALSGIAVVAAVFLAIAPTVILYVAPGGLLAVLANMRDAALRIVAQRNELVVPSLFADMDPEALHLRLIPLAAPIAGSGTQAAHRKYRIWTSRLAVVSGLQKRSEELPLGSGDLQGDPV
jgi:ABC-type branched-subunit amino acid transport system permease subunit